MIESKEWLWEKVERPIWTIPSEESHFYAEKWKKKGYKSILDLGSGLGRHAMLFARQGFKTTAVDLSDYGINYLKHWQKEEGLDILSIVSDMKHLPFRENAFDCIWSYHVISHTDTEGFNVILNNIKKMLKPGGEIYLTLCSKEAEAFQSGEFPQVDQNTILKTEGCAEVDVPHFYVDLDDVLTLFKDFEIHTIRHIHDCYYDGDKRRGVHYFLSASIKKEARPLDYSNVIGKKVKGRIDRPMGQAHPKFPSLIYPVNYGYVEGVMAADGDEQDVYLLGVHEPVETFEGTVIAVIHRYNDVEDKWIVTPDGSDLTDEEIHEAIEFQEKFFDSEIIR